MTIRFLPRRGTFFFIYLFFFILALAVSLITHAQPPPVEFTATGLSPDQKYLQFKIKINTDKPVTQVDIKLKYMDGTGQVLRETIYAWQNIVNGEQKPIEQGKTYEDKHRAPAGTAKYEAKLGDVHFKDGSSWSPK